MVTLAFWWCNKPAFIRPSGPSVVYLAKLEARVGIIHLWACSILLLALSVTPSRPSLSPSFTLFASLRPSLLFGWSSVLLPLTDMPVAALPAHVAAPH